MEFCRNCGKGLDLDGDLGPWCSEDCEQEYWEEFEHEEEEDYDPLEEEEDFGWDDDNEDLDPWGYEREV